MLFTSFMLFFLIFLKSKVKYQNYNPLKKIQKNPYFIILFGVLLNISNVHSQNNNEILTYNWFDKSLGKESLDFNNGTGHLNFDKTIDKQNRYYVADEFKSGSITYNGQNYFNLDLKYDIFNDELVLRPYIETTYIQINLLKEKVDFFKIGNEKFVNLKLLPANLKGGYYEETVTGKNSVLYIKYYKEKREIIKDDHFLIRYIQNYDYVLLKDNKFTLINDKKEIIKLYPEQKRKINDFFFKNKDLKKDNPALFMKNLMKYINNFNL